MMKSKCKKLAREDFEKGIRDFFRLNPELPVHGCTYDFVYDSDEDTVELPSNNELLSNNEQSGGHCDNNNNSSDIFPLVLTFPKMTEEEESLRKNSHPSSISSVSTVPVESLDSCSIGNSISSASSSPANTGSDFINASSSSSQSSLENSTYLTNEDVIMPSIISSRPSTPCSPYQFSIPSPPNSTFSLATTLGFDFNTDPQDILDPAFLLTLNDTDFVDNFSDISDINDDSNNNNGDPLNKITTTNNIYHHDDIENIHIDPLNTKDLFLFNNEDSNNSTVCSSDRDFLNSPVPSTSSQSNLKDIENSSQDASIRSEESSCTNYNSRHFIKSRGRNNKQLQNLYSPATLNRNNSKSENKWRSGRRSERLAIRTAKLKSTTTINKANNNGDNEDSNSNSTTVQQYHFKSLRSSSKQAYTNDADNNNNTNKNIDQPNNSPTINNSQLQEWKQQKTTTNDGKHAVEISKFDCLTSSTMVVQHESLNRESTELVSFSPISSPSSSSSSVFSKEFDVDASSSDEEEIPKKRRRRRRKTKRRRTNELHVMTNVEEDIGPIVDTSKITRTLYEGIFPYKTVEKTKKHPDFRFTIIGAGGQNDNSFTDH